jgi:hypothetical protein
MAYKLPQINLQELARQKKEGVLKWSKTPTPNILSGSPVSNVKPQTLLTLKEPFPTGTAQKLEDIKTRLPQKVQPTPAPVVTPTANIIPREEKIRRVTLMEQQGASQEEIQAYLDYLKSQETAQPVTPAQPKKSFLEWVDKWGADFLAKGISGAITGTGNLIQAGQNIVGRWLNMASNVLLPERFETEYKPQTATRDFAQKTATGFENLQGRMSSEWPINQESWQAKLGDIAGASVPAMAAGWPLGRLVWWVVKSAPYVSKLPVISKAAAGFTEWTAFDIAAGGEWPWTWAVIGTAIPFAWPIARWVWVLGRESLWLSTGTGGWVIWKAWEAASQWWPKLAAFKKWLGTSADDIVTEAKTALGTVMSDRRAAYEKALTTLKWATEKYDIAPVKEWFEKLLTKYGVLKNSKWTLDFSRSPALGRFEKDILDMQKVLKGWGKKEWDNTLLGIDKLKQTLDQFSRNTQESKVLDAFVTSLRNEAKTLGSKNPTYMKMLKDYETSTGFIKELQKWLSLSDKVSTDTAFRKLTSALRTNNEYRKDLIQALDEASGWFLSSKIAGQQMSEILPRGLMKIVTGAGWGYWAITMWVWPAILKLLPAAILTSPRAVQGMLRAAGLPARLIWPLFKAIESRSWAVGWAMGTMK